MGRINRIDRRDIEDMAALGGEQCDILFKRPGIFFQVRRVVELRRIDKNTADHYVTGFPGSMDQFEVTGMQCTHSGYKSNAMTILTVQGNKVVQGTVCFDYQHGSKKGAAK